MRKIYDEWHTLLAESCDGYDEAFLAALIANESSGYSAPIPRFEPAVHQRLCSEHADWTSERLKDNASSWGAFQIMGYNYAGPCIELNDPATSVRSAVDLLDDFAKRWKLQKSDHEQLFHCWNTGRPDAPTYDPNYVSHGLRRVAIYADVKLAKTGC